MDSRQRVAVVGGGLVGLSTAYAVSNRWPDVGIDLFEKEDRVSAHQSGRNSGVIHSGIYYKPGSLKASLCHSGREKLITFCENEKVRYETCGKIIVAVTPEEVLRLDAIYERGRENNVRCTLISSEEIPQFEPFAKGLKAIHVPDAGIVDFPGVARRLEAILRSKGHHIRLGAPVETLLQEGNKAVVTSRGQHYPFDLVITCGGLHADRLARMAGAKPNFQIVPFRGVYYELTPSARKLCQNLIYPVPDPAYPFLGVHFTRMTDGRIEVGPNAILATGREGYALTHWNLTDLSEAMRFKGFRHLARNHWRKGVDELHRTLSKNAYLKALKTLVPTIKAEDLLPCRSGIRAQALNADGTMVDDFVLLDQPNMVHVCNAPSPAATACLAIGEFIVDRLAERLV
ncbi:MAG: L-2-hydroxyglutarate oxidase [Bacteroidetes bacterium]|nr:L-2-hydroxyglutarate oxidase [Bacteroidota bacterium]